MIHRHQSGDSRTHLHGKEFHCVLLSGGQCKNTDMENTHPIHEMANYPFLSVQIYLAIK